MDKCKLCVNKTECGNCDKGWKDKFIPDESVRCYFSRGYVGVRGINGSVWGFNTTNEKLASTKSVVIDGNEHYCAYCASPMFSIQEKSSLQVIGHCCLCDGAMAELEYNEKLEQLNTKHEKELGELKKEYNDKLKINVARLFELKQEKDKKNFDFFNQDRSGVHIEKKEINIKELTFGVRYE